MWSEQRRDASAHWISTWREGRLQPFQLSTIWVVRGILALALTSGLFLRLWQINAVGYNSDEAVYAGQAAALVGVPELQPYFPMFRAHPMLYQYILALSFSFGMNDVAGRLVTIGLGMATILLAYKTGERLYGAKAGAIGALLVAVMPYHVVVTRLVLLDGPMTFFSTLALYLLACYGATQQAVWLYAAGAGMGLTFLAKETAVILLGSVYSFLALAPKLKVRIHDLVISMATMAVVMAAYPLAPRLAGSGGSKKTGQYIIWQLFRRPNHDWTFYPFNVPFAIGLAVVVTALAGLWLMRRKHSWRETLLLAWILVPTVFYQLWPVKGFHYLLTTAPAWAILAARTVIYYMPPHLNARGRRLFQPLIVGIMVFTLFSASWGAVGTIQSEKLLAGTGGTPGGREVGAWISQHTPEGSVFMTLGPSMANILQFYGNRRAYGLSVSSNPLHRNPSYLPILNPDFQLRTGAIQYVVWDAFSASRSEFFEQGLFRYVDRYHGRVVHIETVPVATAEGGVTDKPIIIVYEVRP